MILRKDSKIQENGSALAQLILGSQNKMAEAEQSTDLDLKKARGMVPIKVEEANAMLAPEAAKQRQTAGINDEIITGMQARQPKGTSVNVSASGMAVNPPDPMSNFFKGLAIEDKDDNQIRTETKALQDEYRKVTAFDPEKLAALQDVENLLKQNSRQSYGQLQTALARLKDKGALSDTDVARGLPRTLGRDVKGIAGYLGLGKGPNETMLSGDELGETMRMLSDKRSEMERMRAAGSTELEGRAEVLAPTLHKKGKLKSTLKSLGMSANEPAGAKTVAKTLYSPSRNQTKIIYSDGSEKIKDGK